MLRWLNTLRGQPDLYEEVGNLTPLPVQVIGGAGGPSAQTVAVAAGTVGNTVIKASPGTLIQVLVTAAGGAAVTSFYDNATTNSGTIIGSLPASVAVGTVYVYNMPAAAGITLAGAATNPGMTIRFS